MKTTKITNGRYRTKNNYIVQKVAKGWEVQCEVEGTVLYKAKTKKQAITYCNY